MQVSRPASHADTVERLWRAAAAGRLPHALLFEGPAGIGKFHAAKWFAMGCLCARGPGEPCGGCGPCRRVASGAERGNHADLFVIDPVLEGEERIRIGRIAQRGGGEDDASEQSLESFLSLRALEGTWRVVLVREAQRMNVPAQNALLKTLEEPRQGTLIVLETQRPAALLATLKSRCIRIRFQALPRNACEEVLQQNGMDPAAARLMARLAEGSPGVALQLAATGAGALLERLRGVALLARDPLEVANELWELEGEFSGKTATAVDRERARVVLELAQALVRDALRHAVGVPEEELALGADAADLARRSGAVALSQQSAGLAQLRSEIEQNLTPGPLLERALLLLAEGRPASSPR